MELFDGHTNTTNHNDVNIHVYHESRNLNADVISIQGIIQLYLSSAQHLINISSI